MHELSIVMHIIEAAQKELTKNDADEVSVIELDIGALCGIEMQAFEFAWNGAIENTILKNTKRIINRIQGVGLFQNCKHRFHMNQIYEACPVCNGFGAEIISGKEMRIQSLTLTRKKK